MDSLDSNLKENLTVRVKLLEDNSERLIKLSDRMDALDIEFILNEIVSSNTTSNKVFLSRCFTDGNFEKWKDIGSEAKDAFKDWYFNSDTKEPFELVLPLHLSREHGGHWSTGRILCKKEGEQLKFNVEVYNPSGSSETDSTKAKGILNTIITSLITDTKIQYNTTYEDKIKTQIQGASTFSCGFYTAEIERRLALGLSIDELTKGSLDNNASKIEMLKSLLNRSATVEVVRDENPAPQQKPTSQSKPLLNEASANLLASPKQNTDNAVKSEKSATQADKASKQKFELPEIQNYARKLVIMNYLSSEIKQNNNVHVGSGSKDEFEFDETKLSETLKTFYRTGEVAEDFELKGKVLKYTPKDVLDPPVKEGEKKFMVTLKEEGEYLVMNGEYPFENSGRIKIPSRKTSVDLIVAIQLNGLEQFKDSLEFKGLDLKTNVDKIDFDRRLSEFAKLREKSRSSL